MVVRTGYCQTCGKPCTGKQCRKCWAKGHTYSAAMARHYKRKRIKNMQL